MACATRVFLEAAVVYAWNCKQPLNVELAKLAFVHVHYSCLGKFTYHGKLAIENFEVPLLLTHVQRWLVLI